MVAFLGGVDNETTDVAVQAVWSRMAPAHNGSPNQMPEMWVAVLGSRTTEDEVATMKTYRQVMHDKALNAIRATLLRRGHQVQTMPYNWPYDLLVDLVVRCEVKVAGASRLYVRRGKSLGMTRFWSFNLHRHNKLSEQVDIFLLCLPPVKILGLYWSIWLIVPAKVLKGRKTLAISPRSLLMRWGQWVSRYDLIVLLKREKQGKVPLDNPDSVLRKIEWRGALR